jgi:hypothetical protein
MNIDELMENLKKWDAGELSTLEKSQFAYDLRNAFPELYREYKVMETNEKSAKKAFVNLFGFTQSLMEFLKTVETDLNVPPKLTLKAKVLRWDWEERNKQSREVKEDEK